MLDEITPLILTYNEAPNIGRTLHQLRWARDIVVVDSFSEDETLNIVSAFPQVRIYKRKFDTHEKQWNFGLRETGISSEWILALDADYRVSDLLIDELKILQPSGEISGYRVNFVYCIEGQPLRGTVYPPVTALYRREKAIYEQDGHTQRLKLEGMNSGLRAPIYHDDRKSLGRWLNSQSRYMQLEAAKLEAMRTRDLGWADRLRTMCFPAPFVIFLYCLFIKGAILDGRAGINYAFQRMLAETLLTLYLVGDKMKPQSKI